MDKLSSLSRFKNACPFLSRTQTSTLRTLSTSASPRFPTLTALTERASGCPVMGPALNSRSKEIVAGYASVAGSADVAQIHRQQGVNVPAGATVDMCPHASAARLAAQRAADLATAAKDNQKAKPAPPKANTRASGDPAAAAAGCPFHKAATARSTSEKTAEKVSAPAAHAFGYDKFFADELQKKHDDKSYRYFNNINRLATKFPVAHTGDVKQEVQVWCSNDYLGMGNNPVVLETMQCVVLNDATRWCTYSFFSFAVAPWTSTVMVPEARAI
jgi:5-aminolevulinate synthase